MLRNHVITVFFSLVVYSIIMGCMPSKELRTNLRSDDPNQVIGSTMLRADQIVVLGDSVFLLTKNADGEDAILEISINDKKTRSPSWISKQAGAKWYSLESKSLDFF
jgi:hypothetical protein